MLIKKDAIHPPPIEAEEFLLNLVKKRILMSILFYEPGGIRTPDPRLRRPLLYPTELLIQKKTKKSGWWESNSRVQLGRLTFYHWTTPAKICNQRKLLLHNFWTMSRVFLKFLKISFKKVKQRSSLL